MITLLALHAVKAGLVTPGGVEGIDVELRRLGGEKQLVAKRLAEHVALGQFLVGVLNGLAVVEEIIVGAEELVDSGGVADRFEVAFSLLEIRLGKIVSATEAA